METANRVQKDGRFLFPVRPLAQLFRGKFLKGLSDLLGGGALVLAGTCARLSETPALEVFLSELRNKPWVVYAKRPFGGAEQVYSYLGRYTHRVGLSNRRLVSVGPEQICFQTKQGKTCTVEPMEFIRRFLLHIVPPGLVKIRHFGLLSATGVRTRLPLAQRLLAPKSSGATAAATSAATASAAAPAPQAIGAPTEADYRDKLKALTGIDLRVCPLCHQGRMLPSVLLSPLPRTRFRGTPGPPAPRGNAVLSDSS